MEEAPEFPIPADVAVVHHQTTLPPELRKFWERRHALFSRFDYGVWLDTESWFSITPEATAAYIASRVAGRHVLDLCCGAGGNTIAFAATAASVIAVDIDPVKLACAAHNSRIYGVREKIRFVQGSCLDALDELAASGALSRVDVVFMSPPWGGVAYGRHGFSLDHLPPGLEFREVWARCRAVTRNIVLFLPRSMRLSELGELAGDEPVEAQVVSTGSGRAPWTPRYLVAWFGELARVYETPEERGFEADADEPFSEWLRDDHPLYAHFERYQMSL